MHRKSVRHTGAIASSYAAKRGETLLTQRALRL
jgi:hypothetical protein